MKKEKLKSQAIKITTPKRTMPKAKATPQGPGIIEKGINFLREAKVELKKVVWPARKQVIASTVVVLVFALIAAVFFGLADYTLSTFFKFVMSR